MRIIYFIMRTGVLIHGHCEKEFLPVKEIFEQNFKSGLEIGASFAVVLRGKLVIDLWGGYSDVNTSKPWEKDTIVNVFSTTKVMTALCIHVLVDKGLIDLDAPVAKYWPEFSQEGKEELPVRFLLSHSAGLPGFDIPIIPEDLYDWNKIIDILASQKPWWTPGTKTGYHAVTFGYLLGELVRRITGMSLGNFFRENIAAPLDIDFHIGLSKDKDSRTAEIIPHENYPSRMLRLLINLFFKNIKRVFFNPNLFNVDFNSRECRAAEIPASNGHGNARSIARIGAILANGGELDNKRILSYNTVENAIEKQIKGRDVVMFYSPVKWGLGFGLLNKNLLLGPKSFYWSGAGGSLCVMDLEKRLSIGYAMNKMNMMKDTRAERLTQAVWKIVGRK